MSKSENIIKDKRVIHEIIEIGFKLIDEANKKYEQIDSIEYEQRTEVLGMKQGILNYLAKIIPLQI